MAHSLLGLLVDNLQR